MTETDSTDVSIFVMEAGTWRDRLPAIPRPVLAIGTVKLYRVLMEGSDFFFSFGGSKSSIVGFFTTHFVAASNICEAERKAQAAAVKDWQRQGFQARTGVLPTLRIDTSEAIHSRFRLRSGGGFTFFTSPHEPDSESEISGSSQELDA